ncbi:alpha/beta hydrolase [Paenibacillus sp. N3/727]|uniref:alpha/beta fold hydrolase n=1 Tax=Paenibacillus sp. N3/727 TaxID=2925845 RepID=UPI001F52CAC2|nr:alpha/beta hydrolase [Paenibacillus sp. N3/727]UNK18734.1 alpha/beta hydrolase [Paenibacillus sp. N3/727]
MGYREYAKHEIMKKSKLLVQNGGINELAEIEVNGEKQYILIEGADRTKPFCMFMHGGPGSPFPYGVSARTLYPEITENCVAVYYDQRGAGKSYHRSSDIGKMSLEQFVADANVVVDYVRKQYNQEKVYIVGQSFGTIIATQIVAEHPEKFHAYIGFAQITSIIEGQSLAYEWLIKEARSQNNTKTLQKLDKIGEAPYFGEREDQFSTLINEYKGFNYSDEVVSKANLFSLVKGALTSPDYSLADIYKTFISGADFSINQAQSLKEEIIRTNFFETVPTIQVPVYIIQGRHDKQASYDLARDYYEALDAPQGKSFFTLENSAHIPNKTDEKIFVEHLQKIIGNKEIQLE